MNVAAALLHWKTRETANVKGITLLSNIFLLTEDSTASHWR
jgi:hypothetical protein